MIVSALLLVPCASGQITSSSDGRSITVRSLTQPAAESTAPAAAPDPPFLRIFEEVPEEQELDAAQQRTPREMMLLGLELLQLVPGEKLAELGCHDGRVMLHAAEEYGCRVVGIEIEPDLAAAARSAAIDRGLADRVEVITGDMRYFDPDGVDAVFVYLWQEDLARIVPKLRGRRVVSMFHEVPGLEGGQKIGRVWWYPAAAAQPVEQKTKATATQQREPIAAELPLVTLHISPGTCPPCDLAKEAISRGEFAFCQIEIVVGGRPRYPQFTFTNPRTGFTEVESGFADGYTPNALRRRLQSAGLLQAASMQSSQAVTAQPQRVIPEQTASPRFVWENDSWPLDGYVPCGDSSCPMCREFKRQFRAFFGRPYSR